MLYKAQHVCEEDCKPSDTIHVVYACAALSYVVHF